MRELLKKEFELFVKTRWLKAIDKETDKYRKMINKSNRQLHVVKALLEKYYEIYGEDLRKKAVNPDHEETV